MPEARSGRGVKAEAGAGQVNAPSRSHGRRPPGSARSPPVGAGCRSPVARSHSRAAHLCEEGVGEARPQPGQRPARNSRPSGRRARARPAPGRALRRRGARTAVRTRGAVKRPANGRSAAPAVGPCPPLRRVTTTPATVGPGGSGPEPARRRASSRAERISGPFSASPLSTMPSARRSDSRCARISSCSWPARPDRRRRRAGRRWRGRNRDIRSPPPATDSSGRSGSAAPGASPASSATSRRAAASGVSSPSIRPATGSSDQGQGSSRTYGPKRNCSTTSTRSRTGS